MTVPCEIFFNKKYDKLTNLQLIEDAMYEFAKIYHTEQLNLLKNK